MWVFCSGRNPKGDLLVGLVIFGQTELLCRSGLHGLSGLASEAGAVAQLVAVGGRREATGGHRDQLTPTLTLTFLHTLNWAAAREELVCDIIKDTSNLPPLWHHFSATKRTYRDIRESCQPKLQHKRTSIKLVVSSMCIVYSRVQLFMAKKCAYILIF